MLLLCSAISCISNRISTTQPTSLPF